MSKPFQFNKQDLINWAKTAGSYLGAVALVLIGSKIMGTNFGDYTVGMSLLGGMILDAGRRYLTSTIYDPTLNNPPLSVPNIPTPPQG